MDHLFSDIPASYEVIHRRNAWDLILTADRSRSASLDGLMEVIGQTNKLRNWDVI